MAKLLGRKFSDPRSQRQELPPRCDDEAAAGATDL